MEIKQVVYDYETVPTELRAMVDNILVTYECICSAPYPKIRILIDGDVCFGDGEKAAKALIDTIINDHDESEHGVSWRLRRLDYIGQDILDRHEFVAYYRVRDSY